MSYNDLKIAINRRKKLKQKEQLCMEESAFKTYQIDDFLEVCLPVQAERAEEALLKTKYPNVTKRTEVFVMPDQTVDFLFQTDKNELVTEESAKNLRNSTRQMIMRLQPADTFYAEDTETTETMKVAWFDFDSFGLDGMVYNLMFFTTVQGWLCNGSFHCEGSKAADWKPIFLKVLNSFREMEVCDES